MPTTVMVDLQFVKRWFKRTRETSGALPDFLIIGSQKCGTTYLYTNLLQQHPYIQGSFEPEVHFFNTRDLQGGEKAYREHFPPREYAKIVGEKSPNYLYFPGTAEKVHKMVPNAKLIVLLRNPVDRAYSHYHHSRRLNREPLSFENALEKESERIAVDPETVAFRAFSYNAKGRYANQLDEWLRFFDREQLLILKSENMYENPQETFESVQKFLRVPECNIKSGRGNRHEGRYEEPMALETRESLEAYFRPYNEKLYENLCIDFRW